MDELYVLSSHMFSKSPGVTFLWTDCLPLCLKDSV
jgi:hypothetical protein